eukprot:165513_1
MASQARAQRADSLVLILLKEQSNLLNKECQQFQTEIKHLFREMDTNRSIQERFNRLCNNYSLSLNRICIEYLGKFESDRSLYTSSNSSPIDAVSSASSVKTEYSSSANNDHDEISHSSSAMAVPDLERNDTQFKCEICNKSFKNGAGLAGHNHHCHKKLKIMTKTYECHLCHDEFTSGSALGGHTRACMTVHRNMNHESNSNNNTKSSSNTVVCNTKRHTCHYNDCNSSFPKKKRLYAHIREKHGGYPWNCMGCDEKFKYLKDLNRHRNTVHSSMQQNTFKCAICRMQFASKDILNVHKRTHAPDSRVSPKESDQSVACELCSSSFKSIEFMRTHLVNIHNVNPWKCDQCNQRFRFKKELKKHTNAEYCESEPNGEENVSMDECVNDNQYFNDDVNKLFDFKEEDDGIIIKRSRKKSLFNRRL